MRGLVGDCVGGYVFDIGIFGVDGGIDVGVV